MTRANARAGAGGGEVRVRRVYDPPDPAADGVRVLVDRLWPRGLSKAAAAVDEWPKEVTPSAELRKWFHGGGGGFEEFRERYEAELRGRWRGRSWNVCGGCGARGR